LPDFWVDSYGDKLPQFSFFLPVFTILYLQLIALKNQRMNSSDLFERSERVITNPTSSAEKTNKEIEKERS